MQRSGPWLGSSLRIAAPPNMWQTGPQSTLRRAFWVKLSLKPLLPPLAASHPDPDRPRTLRQVLSELGRDVAHVARHPVWLSMVAAYTLYTAVLGVYAFWGPKAGAHVYGMQVQLGRERAHMHTHATCAHTPTHAHLPAPHPTPLS